MKRLLLPLLAALALPTAVNAESYWLVLLSNVGHAMEKIEMKNMEKCREQGDIFLEGQIGTKGGTEMTFNSDKYILNKSWLS